MTRAFAALLALALSASAPAQAPAGAQFNITQNGKILGEARYSVAPAGAARIWTSSGAMKLGSFAYSFQNAATVDAQGNLVRDALTGSVQGGKASGKDIRFDTASDPSGRQFSIDVAANGTQTGNTIDRHRNLVLVPDLDPADGAGRARPAADGLGADPQGKRDSSSG